MYRKPKELVQYSIEANPMHTIIETSPLVISLFSVAYLPKAETKIKNKKNSAKLTHNVIHVLIIIYQQTKLLIQNSQPICKYIHIQTCTDITSHTTR